MGEMNDDKGGREWGDISNLKKKSQLPKVACCFLGCVMPLVILAVIAGMGYKKVSKSTDRELQWAELEEVLPFAEQPEDLTLMFGLQLDWFDFEFYLLLDSDPDAPDQTDMNHVRDDAWAWILMVVLGLLGVAAHFSLIKSFEVATAARNAASGVPSSGHSASASHLPEVRSRFP